MHVASLDGTADQGWERVAHIQCVRRSLECPLPVGNGHPFQLYLAYSIGFLFSASLSDFVAHRRGHLSRILSPVRLQAR